MAPGKFLDKYFGTAAQAGLKFLALAYQKKHKIGLGNLSNPILKFKKV